MLEAGGPQITPCPVCSYTAPRSYQPTTSLPVQAQAKGAHMPLVHTTGAVQVCESAWPPARINVDKPASTRGSLGARGWVGPHGTAMRARASLPGCGTRGDLGVHACMCICAQLPATATVHLSRCQQLERLGSGEGYWADWESKSSCWGHPTCTYICVYLYVCMNIHIHILLSEPPSHSGREGICLWSVWLVMYICIHVLYTCVPYACADREGLQEETTPAAHSGYRKNKRWVLVVGHCLLRGSEAPICRPDREACKACCLPGAKAQGWLRGCHNLYRAQTTICCYSFT